MELKKEFGINCSNLKGSLAILFAAMILLSIGLTLPATHADPGHGLVLWNKLGSQTEIENSEVGLDGTFSGGSFVEGMFGNAYSADHTQDLLVTFPKEVITTDAGTIEFWAKLTGFPSCMEWWEKPYFFIIWDDYSSWKMGFNGNDGGGNGGLVGGVGHGFMTGTGPYRGWTGWTYEEILGAGQVEAWHHYALVWDENGIAGVSDGTKKVAVFLDGQLNSGRWYDIHGGDSEFVPLTGGELGLIKNRMSQGSAAIDNLLIWNYAKTDFSDRFTEGMIVSCDAMGKEKNQFEPGESVYVKGIRLEADTTYRIWIQYDPVSEGNLLTVTEDPSGIQEEITTNANGDFGPEPIWSIPSYAPPTYDKFDIVVDKLNDGGNTGYYNAASDGLDSVTVVGFVAPVDTEPPTIESVTLDAYTTIPEASIHVTVEATDNVDVTSVTADGVDLEETGNTWEGDITAPPTPDDYTLTIRAEDAAGNFDETTVDYSVVTPQGGLGVAVLPLFSNVIAGDTVDLTVKIISTENFDDKLDVYLSTEGLDNPADLGWFEWTDINEVPICPGYLYGKDIYGDKIVCERSNRIYMYDLSTDTKKQITTGPGDFRPSIYEDKIVYMVRRTSMTYDIYMYDLSTDTEKQITTDPASRWHPKIYGDKIVYYDDRNGNLDIYMYDLSTDTEKQITTDSGSQCNPEIYGDKIVYFDDKNGNYDIYMYDLSTDTERQITTDPASQVYPGIHRDKIVYSDNRNGNWDIHMYDLSTDTEKRITNDPSSQWYPKIYGDKIVYYDDRNGNYDMYMYDLSTDTEKQITTDSGSQCNPEIYGDKIVYSDDRNGDWYIYMYDLSGTKIPARGEITIPLRVEIPTGVSGMKMFRVNVESLIWRTEGFGTGMFGIT